MPAIAKLTLFALDCAEPQGRRRVLLERSPGGPSDRDDGEWVQLRSDGGATLAFQLAPDHVPPVWPSADHPQQAHIDFDVDDLDAGEAAVIAVGARKTDVQPEPDVVPGLPRPGGTSVLFGAPRLTEFDVLRAAGRRGPVLVGSTDRGHRSSPAAPVRS